MRDDQNEDLKESGGSEPAKIAIVGIGCRFPGGASDHQSFWRNLAQGKDCLVETPANRYDVKTLASLDKTKPGRLVGGRGGYIDGFDEFDPAFFGVSPREADYMDPQQRKLLEVTWEALEDGGQRAGELAGRNVGVFIGAFTLDYKIVQFADLGFEKLAAHTATGTMMTMVSNRISHAFDFRGPSMSIDTACSSSLVAVHLACQSLRSGESCLAVAGGTLLHMTPQYTIAETKGGFLSPEGKSRTFDASANGYVRAEGVAVIVLKRLEEALRDGDPIHAVILGSGVNQDGRTNGITVPSAEAQTELISRVCSEVGIEPGCLQYVEAHGTSTPVGDPIEARALANALRQGRKPGDKCYVGSVKTNIGHTESAAGVAGLIKTALSLKYGKIPPHINLNEINPDIDLANYPYTIPTELTEWPEHDGPARAGVNSFGFGGTNAHVLLQEPPRVARRALRETHGRLELNILPISARDASALPELVRGIQAELEAVEDAGAREAKLRDVGYTLARRRQHLESRVSFIYSSHADLRARLAAFLDGQRDELVISGSRLEPARRKLVWVFTGMGPQWWAMGRQLLEREPVFRAAVERCDQAIAALAGWSLIDELGKSEADSQMAETWLAQPANFALQVGLAALWRSLGVRPDAIVGHSAGEVAAFYEAGVYDLADAASVIVHRSRLQQRLVGTGSMLAVGLPEAELLRRLGPDCGGVSIAAVNSPSALTLAGDADALELIAKRLSADGVFAKALRVPVPYHSAKMERIKDELLLSLASLTPRAATVPLYLTAAAGGRADGPELDAAYWWQNVRDSVRFKAAIDALVDDGFSLFLELGPHPVLSSSIVECLQARELEATVLPSIRRQHDEPQRVMLSLAALHNLGVEIAWAELHPDGESVPLPRYPWKRDRYWVESKAVEQVRLGKLDHPLLGRRLATAEPSWESKLETEKLPYLSDHRIQNNVVFPAAGYIEMAAQAVRTLTGGDAVSLTQLELRKALFLGESEVKVVQLALAPDHATFSISSLDTEHTERQVHACGVVHANQQSMRAPSLDAHAIRARASLHLDSASCYQRLARMGYDYGPAFQAIAELWVAPGEALARIAAPAGLAADAAEHHFHPCLLDACFQTLLTPETLAEQAPEGGAGIRLPVFIREICSKAVGTQSLWVHATVTRREADELAGDIAIYDDAGRPLGKVSELRAVSVEKAPSKVGLATIDSWLLNLEWVAREPIAAPQEGAVREPAGAAWLVFSDAHGLGDQVVETLAARGERAWLIRPATQFWFDRARAQAGVVPGSAKDLTRLFAACAQLAEEQGQGPLRGIVHLGNLDAPPLDCARVEDLSLANERGWYDLVALAQVLSAAELSCPLFVVTRGVHAVEQSVAALNVLGAPAWGIGRVLFHQELPGNRGKLIDLDPAGATGGGRTEEARALVAELFVNDEDEIALRGDARFTSRLRKPRDLTRPLPLRLRADGCYLVTGAFGALGQLLCRLLVKRGARRLVLVGRTKLPERADWRDVDPASAAGRNIRFVRELEALGADPILAAIDVADAGQLATWLAHFRRLELPPIRGVFHSAGQVHDALVAQMDRATFDAAADPKIRGAYLLHEQLADEPLDHFVLFSSIASLMTTAGQTNYAAGNAFLDALALHRRARGLPALSIDWGPWATGMIEELGLVDHYRNSRGMSCLPPDAGMDVLERVLGQQCGQIVVATIVNWPVFLAWYHTTPPLVSELALDASASSADVSGGSFADLFRSAPEQARRGLVEERFAALIAEVLRVDPAQLDAAASLHALGLDSLLAIELRTRLGTELRVSLPVVTLLSGSSISQLVDKLHENACELIARSADSDDAVRAVELFSDERAYPLTHNQKALWFLKQLNPNGFAYNIGGAVEVRSQLEPELMFDAVRFLIRRHPLLRTNFRLENGNAVQFVSETTRPDVKLIDVQGKSWDEIYALIIKEYRKPYDLEHDALVRFRLFKRADDRYVIMKAVHHIISDAISTFTFIEELLAIYQDYREGRSPEPPALSARYLDFLNWQNQLLAGSEADRMLAYWKQHLPAELPVLNLPTDRPRSVVQTDNGGSRFFVLDTELSARVHALSQESGVTVFMILLGAYYLLLQRYAAQDEIIVGTPVTGRTDARFASVYGYFVNPLPLHVSLAGDPSFHELLSQVQTVVLNGLDNQDYPFVSLVEKLALPHDPSRSAVFQAMFILLVHRVAAEKYGHKLEYIELPEEEGQFELTLSAYEDVAERRFHCVFKYNSDLFDATTVARMARHYTNLLDAVTRAPESRLSEHDMLGADERAEIVEHWSGAKQRTRHITAVPTLISRVAKRRPGAIAVASPEPGRATRRLTYGQLDAQSNRLARHLMARGVGRGSVVGICLDKRPELVTSLLAVLKTGAAYLPLDPDQPLDRQQHMLQDAAVTTIVADRAARARLGDLPAISFVTLDQGDLRAELEQLDAAPLEGVTHRPDDLAYVVFTSGSTGRPKGVMVTHGNLASAYAAWEAEYGLRSRARVHLQMASFSFDVFSGDLVRALCSGGKLVLAPRELLLNSARLYETMRSEDVDAGEFVPAVVRGLMTYCEGAGQRLDFMRLIVVGSDVWKVEEYARLRALSGAYTRVVNSYGLSEATVDSTYFEGSVQQLQPSQMVPIGRPFPNSRIYILDARGRAVPAGVPGELYVGGAGVAAGYVGDDAQNAQRFVTLDLGAGPERLYRTGDMARWDASGGLHLIGRVDGQVKVRGHRIETAEIEAQLAVRRELARTVVVARPDAQGEAVLCAYCVPVAGAAVDGRALRQHLSTLLPTFMIPTHFVAVDDFPLTSSGKVDINALPLPARHEAAAVEAPVTPYEQRVAELWQRLLGVDRVGLQDDFFELGGSSVKLIELIYHLQTEFEIAISVSQLFKVSTLLGMARAVEDVATGRGEGAQPYLRFNAGREQTIFCFPPAGGHGLVYRRLASHMPEYAFVSFNYLAGDDKVRRYADMIESIQETGPCALFGYSLGGNLAFEVAKELERRGREVPNVVIMDSYRILESFEFSEQHLAEFERELREHLRKHTGSAIVERETLDQAKEYIHFFIRTLNAGTVLAPVSIIADEDKVALYAAGKHGSWHGSSATSALVFRGHGKHADMLDEEYVSHNAGLARAILNGSYASAAE